MLRYAQVFPEVQDSVGSHRHLPLLPAKEDVSTLFQSYFVLWAIETRVLKPFPSCKLFRLQKMLLAVRPALRRMLSPRSILSFSSKTFPSHTVINMPALSPTMTQGNLGSWQKSVGDEVVSGDILVEIETDKAQMDFECMDEGYLASILVPSGTQEVQVNNV